MKLQRILKTNYLTDLVLYIRYKCFTMLPAKPLLFAQFAKTLLFFAISTCLGQALARADTDMQITAPPLVIHDPRDSANAQNATADWVKNYGGQLPLIYTTESGQGAADLRAQGPSQVSSLGDPGQQALNKLVLQIVNFADGITSSSTSFENDFHAQFMHAISNEAPGFAWVVVAQRTGFDLGWMDGFKAGGAAGVQIPLLGSKNLWLANNQGQVVLRILPIGGNYESVETGPNPLNEIAAPGSGLILRPTAELEADYQMAGIQPGIRILVQPKLLQPNQARMVAEVFMNIDFNVPNSILTKVSIVPRCMIQIANDPQAFTGPYAQSYQLGARILDRDETCSISAQFAFGTR